MPAINCVQIVTHHPSPPNAVVAVMIEGGKQLARNGVPWTPRLESVDQAMAYAAGLKAGLDLAAAGYVLAPDASVEAAQVPIGLW